MRINALGNTATDFASDDFVAIDGATNGSRKLKNDMLSKLMAQAALAGNVAEAFDPTRTNTNPYKAGESVIYNGKLYTFSVDHYGAWNASDVGENSVINLVDTLDKFTKRIVDTSEGANYTENSVYDATYPNTIFHPTNGPSTNNTYISYGIKIYAPTKLYVKNCNSVYFSICVYPSDQAFNNGVRYRLYNGSDDLPYVGNPLQLNTGEYVVISTRNSESLNPFTIFFTDWLSIDNLSPKVPLAPSHIQQVTDSIKDRIYIQKRDLSASKDIYVYVPAKVGYVRYAFHFYENLETASNYSLWRLQWVDVCDDNMAYIDHLSVSGEWECALKLKDADDFMGGSTHGDEVMSDVGFWVDGQEVSFAELINGWCKEFRLARKSTMYDPSDHTTPTVEHGCEYVFDLGGLIIQQSVKWLVDATVTNCYMGMNLPKKSYTTKGYIDLAIDPSSIPAYSRYQDASKMVLWDATSGVFNLFENLGSTIADYLGNNSLYFTDNGGNAYNKGYYCITYTTQQVDIPANTIWKSKTHYVYDVATDLSN